MHARVPAACRPLAAAALCTLVWATSHALALAVLAHVHDESTVSVLLRQARQWLPATVIALAVLLGVVLVTVLADGRRRPFDPGLGGLVATPVSLTLLESVDPATALGAALAGVLGGAPPGTLLVAGTVVHAALVALLLVVGAIGFVRIARPGPVTPPAVVAERGPLPSAPPRRRCSPALLARLHRGPPVPVRHATTPVHTWPGLVGSTA
ncbi:hypothetical protein [Pseudonocardia thermophila]|uniref:hypothetical protein n=1 Tax=Pseudonocardia thermophila TaxID=1848 RepID=UPI00248EA6A2|nr:hypothetical protein [Pseudonocardia thermophila]